MNKDFRYCPFCAEILVDALRFNAVRPACISCGFVQFHDPKVAVIALVHERDKVLLVQRAVDPAKGKWSLPGGYMDAGEMPREALLRELREEVGLSPQIGALIDIFPMVNGDGDRIGIVLAFRAQAADYTEIPFVADDAQDAGWYGPQELPLELAFDSTRDLLQEWKTALQDSDTSSSC